MCCATTSSRAFLGVAMQLSEMLGLPVHDAGNHIVGTVVDVRLTTSTDRAEPPNNLTCWDW